MRVASAVLLLLASIRDAAAVSIDVENGVYKLQEATFDTVVKKFPAVMVKFYAPWCGHCKAMVPAYEKAARRLKKAAEESGDPAAHPRLAKVDATVEKDLAKKYEVQGFPSLVVFKDGEFFATYQGGRDKDDFLNYMQTVGLPLPLGFILRAYYVASGVYKDVVRVFVPGRYRKYAFAAFPALLAMPSLLVLCCCGGGSKKRGAAAKRGRSSAKDEDKASAEEKDSAAGGGLQKRKGRSSSPAGPSSSGKASRDGAKAEGDEGESKETDETKED